MSKFRKRPTEPAPKGFVAAVWRRREPILWALLVVFAVATQWPMLKGWYYRAAGTPEPPNGIHWQTNFQTALDRAKARHSLVLVDFSATWCPPCLAMKHDVWPNADVTALVKKSFVPVSIDIDHDNGLSGMYNVSGIPAVLVLDASGRVLRRHDGYLPVGGMLQFLDPANAN